MENYGGSKGPKGHHYFLLEALHVLVFRIPCLSQPVESYDNEKGTIMASVYWSGDRITRLDDNFSNTSMSSSLSNCIL